MKKCLTWLLLFTMLLSLAGCGNTAPVETTAQTEAPETTAPAETAAAETEPAVLENQLFLKVSAIDFSLVGECEDIYLGLVPREDVTWESDDPSVVSVENGVLTATGVGSTTIRATYQDTTMEIPAGCLANSWEELAELPNDVLSAPRRLPPQVDLTEPCTYFDNDAIVGDSITYFLFQWESKTNYLGDMLFLARGGVSMNGFVMGSKNIYYRGGEMRLENAIGEAKPERVYFLMGSNDVSSKNQRPHVFENWTIMLERIREQHPDVEIVLMSNIPEYDPGWGAQEKNLLIEEYNVQLKQFAADNDCLFLDLNYYCRDHYDRLPERYAQGNYHMNEAGCLNWMKILRFYAYYESQGGTLS